MEKFAKLIEVEAGQLLATIEPNDDDPALYQLNLRLYKEGATVTTKLTAESRGHALQMMELTNESVASDLYSNLGYFTNYTTTLTNQYNAKSPKHP